ncbi:hypothetical protein ACB092_10G157400 [Castanea dentata]
MRILPEAICENCKAENEDVSYAICFCSSVQEAWTSDPQWSWISTMKGQPTLEIFKHAFSEKKDPSLLAVMTWALWYRRNQIRFNESVCPLSQITHLSKGKEG